MKTKISTDGETSTIILVPENDFEVSIIKGMTTYHMTCEVVRLEDTKSPVVIGESANQYLRITLNHK